MTHVVTQRCIKCRYTDCVDVCPVDCFREGPNFLAIDPDECIDCAVCVAECPVNAIYAEEDVQATSGTLLNLILNYRNAGPASQKAKAHCLMRMNGKTLKTSWICWSANG